MELVWNMPIHLLSSDSDSKTHSDALQCHKQWRNHVLPSLAKASHKDAQIFLEVAQECETEHIAAAAKCKETASQYKQKDSSKFKGKTCEVENQSNGHVNLSNSKSEDQHLVKMKCRCHRKPCTCGAKYSHSPTVTVPVSQNIEPVSSGKRARPPGDEASLPNDSLARSHPERVLDSAEDVLLARDTALSQHCKDALECLMKHRRSEFFSVPGVTLCWFFLLQFCCLFLRPCSGRRFFGVVGLLFDCQAAHGSFIGCDKIGKTQIQTSEAGGKQD
jgi:hypothetical protein